MAFRTNRATHESALGEKTYSDWHWGIAPKTIIDWDDPDLPEGEVIECGRLVELHYREPGQRKDTVMKLSRKEANGSHLVYDPNHPYGRLYILSHADFTDRMKKKYRNNPNFENGTKYREAALTDLARAVGGRHATGDYPDVDAAPVGILTHVVYATEKKGDGYSFYIHKLGEESGVRPCLAIDAKGRLWIVGGNYRGNPTPGITD
jgi:hypothetical protein